jgi:hypothetical protein
MLRSRVRVIVRFLLLGIALGATLVAAPVKGARAAFISGNVLHDACQAPKGSAKSGLCYGFIAGTFDALLTSASTLGSRMSFCTPDGVTLGQVIDITTQYLIAHPEQRQNSASSLVWLSLVKAFPCAKEQ